MVLPAMGMLSEIIPVFSRKPIFGYKAIAFSTIGIAFASMLVWAHHMFTVGLSDPLQAWFMIVSFSVAVPTAIKIFNWLATLWKGQLWFRAPLLFCARVHRALRHGRPLGDHARDLPRGLPDTRLLLRRRALPLRALRRHGLRDLRRHVLLVPEDHGADVRRAPREAPLLAHVRRLQRGLPAPAHARADGDAAGGSTRTSARGSSSGTT